MPPTPTAFATRLFSLLLAITLIFTPLFPANAAFTVGDEMKAGEKIQSTIHQEFLLMDDPDIDHYITRLGREILAVAGPQYFDYRFYVVNDRDFNAFAAPSGLVFINSGLIETVDNEDELVGVMAHEIAHVTRRHIADSIDKGTKIGIGTAALILAGIALGGGNLSEAVITGAMAAGTSMNLQFSRENEEEADRQSFSWLRQMKRDPNTLVSMMGKMRRISILKTGKTPAYLLTHPAPELRMDYIQDLLLSEGNSNPTEVTDNFHFNRIKYRILVKSRETTSLLPILLKKIDSAEADAPMARYGLALIYQQEGNLAKSRQYLNEVIADHPGHPILKTDLGLGYIQEGKTAEALKLFLTAHAAAPDDPYTTFQLARTLDENGQTAKAIDLYREMLSQTPSFAKLNFYLGQALAKSGHAGQGHYYNGVSSWLEGNLPNATYHLKKALDILPAADQLHQKSRDLLDKIKQLEKI